MTKRTARASLLALLLAQLLLAGAALAQTTATTSAQRPVPAGFEPVSGQREENKLNPNPLVAAAYAGFFLCMFGYVVHIARSQTRIAREMAELAERLASKSKP